MRVALVLLLLVAPFAAAAAGDIHPGDKLNGTCTLNFVFDGIGPRAGKVYIGTAAHCVLAIGDAASTPAAGTFGHVVYVGDLPEEETNGLAGSQLDFALIEVAPDFQASLRPDVRGHPGMPTGVTSAATTGSGDLLIVSGHGLGFGLSTATRENRTGVLIADDARSFLADTMAVPGDSGGPLLHADGRALGTISRLALFATPPSTDDGPTVAGILAELASVGFPVTLRTAS